MQALRGSVAVTSFFRHKKWTDLCHVSRLSTTFSRVAHSSPSRSVGVLSQARLASSWTALFRRKKAVKVEAAGSTPTWNGDTPMSVEGKEQILDCSTDKSPLKFIPITRQDMVKALAAEDSMLTPEERQHLPSFVAALNDFTLRRFYTLLEDVKLLYEKLDPNKDTIRIGQVTRKELLDDEYWLFQKLEMLLHKTNYARIPGSKLLHLLHEHSTQEGIKVSVNPSSYDALHIWTQGIVTVPLSPLKRLQHALGKRIWKDYKKPSNDFYTRVFVGVRSKSEKNLYLKVFKEVPCNELDYLVPGGKIMMSNFDKGILTFGMCLGGIAVILKLFSLASTFGLDWAWIGLACATVTGSKGWIGYANKKSKYLAKISSAMYFKTVSTNRGVLTLLSDYAQDVELKECLLTYLFLLGPKNRRGLPGTTFTVEQPKLDNAASLKNRIEKWLHEQFGCDHLPFDIDDALLRLDSMGLLLNNSDGSLSVISMDNALALLKVSPPGSLLEHLQAHSSSSLEAQ